MRCSPPYCVAKQELKDLTSVSLSRAFRASRGPWVLSLPLSLSWMACIHESAVSRLSVNSCCVMTSPGPCEWQVKLRTCSNRVFYCSSLMLLLHQWHSFQKQICMQGRCPVHSGLQCFKTAEQVFGIRMCPIWRRREARSQSDNLITSPQFIQELDNEHVARRGVIWASSGKLHNHPHCMENPSLITFNHTPLT